MNATIQCKKRTESLQVQLRSKDNYLSSKASLQCGNTVKCMFSETSDLFPLTFMMTLPRYPGLQWSHNPEKKILNIEENLKKHHLANCLYSVFQGNKMNVLRGTETEYTCSAVQWKNSWVKRKKCSQQKNKNTREKSLQPGECPDSYLFLLYPAL